MYFTDNVSTNAELNNGFSSIPQIFLNEGHPLGIVKEKCTLYDSTPIILPTNQLFSCVKGFTADMAYPLLTGPGPEGNQHHQLTEDDIADDMVIIVLSLKEYTIR